MVPSKNNVDILTQDPYFVLFTSSRVKIISFTNPYLKTSNINMKKKVFLSLNIVICMCAFKWLTVQSCVVFAREDYFSCSQSLVAA